MGSAVALLFQFSTSAIFVDGARFVELVRRDGIICKPLLCLSIIDNCLRCMDLLLLPMFAEFHGDGNVCYFKRRC